MSKYLPTLLVALVALMLTPAVLADDAPEEKKEGANKPVVALVSPGAEPRTELRYKPTKGAKLDLGMKLTIEIESMMGTMALPTVVIDGTHEVLSVEDNGDFKARTTFDELSTEGEDTTGMGAMILGSIDVMKGFTITATASCEGHSKDVSHSEIEAVDPQQKSMLDTLKEIGDAATIPLPKEAVGVGGKWTVTKDGVSSNIKYTQVMTFEVAKIDGDRVALKVKIEQTADKQKVSHPMGFMMDVESFSGSGTGTMVLDLVRATTVEGTQSLKSDISCSVDMGMGEPQQMDQSVSVASAITTRPAAVATTTPGDGEK